MASSIYGARALGFCERAVQLGMGITAGCVAFSAFGSDDQKKALANGGVRSFRLLGVKEENLSDADLLQKMWKGIQSFANVMVTSPLFYACYNGFHPEDPKLSIRQLFITSTFKGFSGTFRAVPTFVLMYGGATALMPIVENALINSGMKKEEAQAYAEAAVFVGAAAAPELYAEAVACNVKKVTPWPMALGSVFIAGRLCAGVLTQYRAIDSEEQGAEDPYRKYKDFVKALAGTTIMQHLLNGTMQTMTRHQGVKGIGFYALGGSVKREECSIRGGMGQLSKTTMQRFLFMGAWNYFSHLKHEEPKWVKV